MMSLCYIKMCIALQTKAEVLEGILRFGLDNHEPIIDILLCHNVVQNMFPKLYEITVLGEYNVMQYSFLYRNIGTRKKMNGSTCYEVSQFTSWLN